MDQNILDHVFRHTERRNCLKMHFCLTEIFALSVELHQISCPAFGKLLCLSAAYVVNTFIIQKLQVCRTAVGSSVFMMCMIISD